MSECFPCDAMVDLCRYDPRKTLHFQVEGNTLLCSFVAASKGGVFTKIKIPSEQEEKDSPHGGRLLPFRIAQGIVAMKTKMEELSHGRQEKQGEQEGHEGEDEGEEGKVA